MGVPVLVNPNSYKNVKTVLDDFIGNVIMGCDGLPYLASSIIKFGKTFMGYNCNWFWSFTYE